MLDPIATFNAAVNTFDQAVADYQHGNGDEQTLRERLDVAFHDVKRLAPAAIRIDANVHAAVAIVINTMRQCQRQQFASASGAFDEIREMVVDLTESVSIMESRIRALHGKAFLEFDPITNRYLDSLHILPFCLAARQNLELMQKVCPQMSAHEKTIFDAQIEILTAQIRRLSDLVHAENIAALERARTRNVLLPRMPAKKLSFTDFLVLFLAIVLLCRFVFYLFFSAFSFLFIVAAVIIFLLIISLIVSSDP